MNRSNQKHLNRSRRRRRKGTRGHSEYCDEKASGIPTENRVIQEVECTAQSLLNLEDMRNRNKALEKLTSEALELLKLQLEISEISAISHEVIVYMDDETQEVEHTLEAAAEELQGAWGLKKKSMKKIAFIGLSILGIIIVGSGVIAIVIAAVIHPFFSPLL